MIRLIKTQSSSSVVGFFGRQSMVLRELYILPLLFILIATSCKKLVSIDAPKNELIQGTVFSDDATASSAMAGIYADMSSDGHYLSSLSSGLKNVTAQSADEYNAFSNAEFFENELNPDNSQVRSIWQSAYNTIYEANVLLEGVAGSTGISAPLKQQLQGEAKFIRAFNYFYLVNLYGEVPLIIGTDYTVNRIASRASVSQVYELIVSDLKDAQNMLATDYSYSAGQRVRANKAVATALLARVYLYLQQWDKSEVEATAVINNSSYQLVDLNSPFLANNTEAIWQLLPSRTFEYNAPEAYFSSYFSPYGTAYGSFTEQLANAFEPGDNRKTIWTGTGAFEPYMYARKYKADAFAGPPYAEYTTLLRLAEQYLIRAEARAQIGGDLTGAIADVDSIRNRAGLPLIGTTNPGISQANLLLAIEQERRIEFFTEGGHRWLDLKRWGKANAVLGPIKANWDPTDVLYPIPTNDRLRDPNLTQNPGYPN